MVKDPAAVALAEEVVLQDHAQGRVYQVWAAVESLLRVFFVTSFPEARTEVHSITADETSAVLGCAFHGKKNGPFLGIPATGRQVVLPMTVVCQIADGQIRRLGLYYDAGDLLRQLRLVL